MAVFEERIYVAIIDTTCSTVKVSAGDPIAIDVFGGLGNVVAKLLSLRKGCILI
jgi:hypothetical protein